MLYDVVRRRQVFSFAGHHKDVNSVKWLDDDGRVGLSSPVPVAHSIPQVFATASDDCVVKVAP